MPRAAMLVILILAGIRTIASALVPLVSDTALRSAPLMYDTFGLLTHKILPQVAPSSRRYSLVLSQTMSSMSNTDENSSSSSSSSSDVASSARSQGLFHSTPLLLSTPLTSLCSRPIYVKLDALQPSGSFKDRGMAHLCDTLRSTRGTTKLISSSGGNAGLAVATVAKRLQMNAQVIVPKTTKKLVIDKLKSLGADVTVHGENWNAADMLAQQRAAEDPAAEYVSPYDNPLLWTGHSTVVDELLQELSEKGNQEKKVGAIIASVGGGGLVCGIFEGLTRHKMFDTAVVAAETEGASSFGQAFIKGETVRLEKIDSIATSLGALQVTDVALDRAREHQEKGGIVKSSICTDAEAVDACIKFAADHRVLVEPACGAALAVVYSDRLRKEILDDIEGAVVVEICGGSGVNLDLLEAWKKQFLC